VPREEGHAFRRSDTAKNRARKWDKQGPMAAAAATVVMVASLGLVRNPSQMTHTLTFEGFTSNCDFAKGVPISNEYATRAAQFTGPGFGALNGGVPMHGCTVSGGDFPPLGNDSFSGSGFLGFSTLHTFNDRAGKPISPEIIRFDVRVTNMLVSLAGIDGHSVSIEMWSGAGRSYNDAGELLQSFSLPVAPTLQRFSLVDETASAA
jgi:hypothetical protein